jgi:hypothetical protein
MPALTELCEDRGSTMKQQTQTKARPRYRLSPNEVEQLKKEETERRRKLRIVQVWNELSQVKMCSSPCKLHDLMSFFCLSFFYILTLGLSWITLSLLCFQVREQSKNAAAKIRNDVQQERKRQLVKLAKEIEVTSFYGIRFFLDLFLNFVFFLFDIFY